MDVIVLCTDQILDAHSFVLEFLTDLRILGGDSAMSVINEFDLLTMSGVISDT